MVLADLAEFTHFVTRIKIVPAVADDISLGEAERTRGRALAAALSMRVLSRTWQMLLKGIAEVQAAGRPLAAAEMVLVRIAYVGRPADAGRGDPLARRRRRHRARRRGRRATATAAARAQARPAPVARRQLPARRRRRRRATTRRAAAPRAMAAQSAPAQQPAAAAQSAPALAINNFAELVALASDKRDIQTKLALERDVRLVRCEDGTLEIALEPSARQDAGQRSVAQAAAMDRPVLDGGGLARARRSRR